ITTTSGSTTVTLPVASAPALALLRRPDLPGAGDGQTRACASASAPPAGVHRVEMVRTPDDGVFS
ncbi:unnamed protein product, partial [Urochloa humidicola]